MKHQQGREIKLQCSQVWVIKQVSLFPYRRSRFLQLRNQIHQPQRLVLQKYLLIYKILNFLSAILQNNKCNMEPEQHCMSQQAEEVLNFAVFVNGVKKDVTMDNQRLQYAGKQIQVYDMIGVVENDITEEGYRNYTLYSYPRLKKMFTSPRRYIQKFDFQIRDQPNWQKDLKNMISRIYNRPPESSLKLLIIYNPISGSNSQKNLRNITNFIKFTNLQPEIMRTNHRNHCSEYLKTINPKEYCGVAIVSGDGLMHEYVNSFCEVPVTHVPAGSGNAFAKTQMEYAGELCKDQESIFLVIKNNPREFNLAKYELERLAQPVYSFLSLEWAMFADFDVNSEYLRCIGLLRFQVYAAWLLLKHKRYRARLTYSTIKREMPSFDTDVKNDPNYITIEDEFAHTIFCTIPFISEKHKIAPLIQKGQQFIDMQVMKHQTGRYQLFKYLISSDSGTQFDLQQQRPAAGYDFIYRKVTSFRLEPLDPNQPGIYCIDGEVFQSQKIQASISDKTFRAFT